MTKPRKGDLDGMIERRVIRALVVYNSTNFCFDEEAKPRGISHDFLREFEKVGSAIGSSAVAGDSSGPSSHRSLGCPSTPFRSRFIYPRHCVKG